MRNKIKQKGKGAGWEFLKGFAKVIGHGITHPTEMPTGVTKNGKIKYERVTKDLSPFDEDQIIGKKKPKKNWKKNAKKHIRTFGKWLKKNNTKKTGESLKRAISEAKKTYKDFKNINILGAGMGKMDPFAGIHDPKKLYRWDKLFNG